jgi:hypothetical protein
MGWRRDDLSRALGEFLFPRYLSFQARKRVFCCSAFILNDILFLLSSATTHDKDAREQGGRDRYKNRLKNRSRCSLLCEGGRHLIKSLAERGDIKTRRSRRRVDAGTDSYALLHCIFFIPHHSSLAHKSNPPESHVWNFPSSPKSVLPSPSIAQFEPSTKSSQAKPSQV